MRLLYKHTQYTQSMAALAFKKLNFQHINIFLPHAASIFQSIRATFKRTIKMAVHFVLSLATLIEKSQFEQCSHVRTLASQGNKNRDIDGLVFLVFAIRVKINSPLVTSNGKGVAGYILAHPHALSKGVAVDGKMVRAIDGFCDRT